MERVISKFLQRAFLMLMVLVGISNYANAYTDPTKSTALIGSQGQIVVGRSDTTIDDKFYTLSSLIDTTYSLKNIVSLSIDPLSPVFILSNFTTNIKIEIKTTNAQNQTNIIEKILTVNYKKGDGIKYDATQYYNFENATKVEVKILEITSDVTWNTTQVLILKNELTANRDYAFNCATIISGLAFETITIPATDLNKPDEIKVSWADPNNGQTDYDLEWAWIDQSALALYPQIGGNYIQQNIFENNATRVTITEREYKVPLLYDGDGKLFIRVRPVQLRNDGRLIEGAWSAQNTTSIFDFTGHATKLNWQASSSYAEEGKHKSVVQYFDGTLRNRQTVTKDNSSKTTVVAETFYDYQGRPVIQVLPSPTLSNIIQYVQNFNKSITTDGYPKSLYDKLAPNETICSKASPALSTASGAAQYYSPNNPLLTGATTGGINNFIPNAEDTIPGAAYPFSETRYAPDGSGRIASQGGVGVAHQLGSNHETKYFYTGADQRAELDPLFGTDAGTASHYSKSIVKDANGQYSISYTDMHGRTIATALAGNTPQNLDTLPSYITATRNVTRDLLPAGTNVIAGRTIRSSQPLMALSDGNFHFQYELTPENINVPNCDSTNICYDCLYSLKITLSSDCNTDAPTIIGEKKNFTLNQYLKDTYLTDCNSPNFIVDTSIFLNEGAYTVTKELTLSAEAQNYYRDSVFLPANNCKTEQTYVTQEYNLLTASANCTVTCQTCLDSLGANYNAYRNIMLRKLGVFYNNQSPPQPLSTNPLTEAEVLALEPQFVKAYAEAKANCEIMCNPDGNYGVDYIKSIRDLMLHDMIPSTGQYARFDRAAILPDGSQPGQSAVNYTALQYNIFNPSDVNPIYVDSVTSTTSSGNDWKHPLWYNTITNSVDTIYKDIFDQRDSVNAKITSTASPLYTKEQFANEFNTKSWPESLLPHHPEYCKLRTLESVGMKNAFAFETKLLGINTWADAVLAFANGSSGTPFDVVGKDQFFTTLSPSLPAVSSPSAASMQTLVNVNYQSFAGNTWSMWRMAQIIAFCRNIPNTNPISAEMQTCYNSKPLVPTNLTNQISNGTSTCPDWDYTWTIFRSLYLTERKNYIDQYIQAQCAAYIDPTQAFFSDGTYTLRFQSTTPGSYNTGNDDLNQALSDLNNGIPNSPAAANLLGNQAEATCRSYASSWLDALKKCPTINALFVATPSDEITIIDNLVGVCKKGYDATHPLGASTISPNVTPFNGFSSFPDVIKDYLLAHGINQPWTALCNPNIIKVPAPYEHSPALTNQLVITKPDSCQCEKLQTIKNEYLQNPGGSPSLSNYLLVKYGTNIRQGLLDTLIILCRDGNINGCNFLATPIAIPPILQCNGPVKTCINCNEYNVIKAQFYSEFGPIGIVPISAPQSPEDFDINIAFANYVNIKTGFNKTWMDYAAFSTSCLPGDVSKTKSKNSIGNMLTDKTPETLSRESECTNLENLYTEYYHNFINPQSREVVLDIRTFYGNKIPCVGNVGVFDVNGDLIGNTTLSADGNDNFVSIWNSSPINAALGTLYSIRGSCQVRLKLKSDQIVPCNGVNGMRYYTFLNKEPDLNGVVVGPGCYIDFNDGIRTKVDTSLSTANTRIEKIIPFRHQQKISYYVRHKHEGASPDKGWEVKVYHSDTLGIVGFDRIVGNDGSLSTIKNLKGYLPEHTEGLVFHSTRDTSLSTFSKIENRSSLKGIRWIETWGHDEANPFLGYNFGVLDNYQTLESIFCFGGYPMPTAPANILHLKNIVQNPLNAPNLKYLAISKNGYTNDVIINYPQLRIIDIQYGLLSFQVDSILNQIARYTLTNNGKAYLGNGNEARTSASDAAYNTLITRGWTIAINGNGVAGAASSTPQSITTTSEYRTPAISLFSEYYSYATNQPNSTIQQTQQAYNIACGYVSSSFCGRAVNNTNCEDLLVLLNNFLSLPTSSSITEITCGSVGDAFTIYFNNHLGTNYTYLELIDIYKSCNIVFGNCSVTDCATINNAYISFLHLPSNNGITEITCGSLGDAFTVYFNNYFGTQYTYLELITIYKRCNIALGNCSVTNCETINNLYNSFLNLPLYTGAGITEITCGAVSDAFTLYVNNYFGTQYTYLQLIPIFKRCNIVLKNCSVTDCETLNNIYNNFLNLPLNTGITEIICGATGDAFTLYFNNYFGTHYTYLELIDIYKRCNIGLGNCSVTDCKTIENILKDFLQQPIYLDLGIKEITCGTIGDAFTTYFNIHFGTNYTYIELITIYKRCGIVLGDCPYYDCERINEVLQNFFQQPLYNNIKDITCGPIGDAFTAYFNNYFGTHFTYLELIEIYKRCGFVLGDCDYTDCEKIKKVHDDFLLLPLNDGIKEITCGPIGDAFTAYFNNYFGTHFTYLQLIDLFKKCNIVLGNCTYTNCDSIKVVYFDFIKLPININIVSITCGPIGDAFTNFFNNHFGTHFTYLDLIDLYKKCGIFLGDCPYNNCDSLIFTLNTFYRTHPEIQPNQITCGSISEAFTAYFNNHFGTHYTYAQLIVIYAKCGQVFEPCPTTNCENLLNTLNGFINSTYYSNNTWQLGLSYDGGTITTANGALIKTIQPVTYQNCVSNGIFAGHPDSVYQQQYYNTVEGNPNIGHFKFSLSNKNLCATIGRDFSIELRSRIQPNFPKVRTNIKLKHEFNLDDNKYFSATYAYAPNTTSTINLNFGGDLDTVIRLRIPIQVISKDWHVFKYSFGNNVVSVYFDGALIYKVYPKDYYPSKITGINFTQDWGTPEQLDYIKIINTNGTVKWQENFDKPTPPQIPYELSCTKITCAYVGCTEPGNSIEFTQYFNYTHGTNYTYEELIELYIKCGIILGPCSTSTGPLLCGLSDPIAVEDSIRLPDPCDGKDSVAATIGEIRYTLYLDSLRNVFDTAYYNKCMKAASLEKFTVTYSNAEHHYTLYYYDQAGNLVKTVPPAGVDAKHGDVAFLDGVKQKRLNVKNGQPEANNILTPTHSLKTNYRYNTLNQVIAQKTPDAGESKFYYDRLGRLVLSQNAKQAVVNRVSYTEYDYLGRISQVGEINKTTLPDTRDKNALAAWFTSNRLTKKQITRTVYDVSYFNGEIPTTLGDMLVQRNLRNRVSYTQVFDTEPAGNNDLNYASTHRTATYYSYDIHGNVDSLMQDYGNRDVVVNGMNSTNNRFKKIAYNFDLISGKVNKVSYQPGYADEFYHRYTYDAENRLTIAETSHDDILWERDARYTYYKHGPQARTIIGEEQVQGVDYAYTLQGWLKGINSTGLQGGDGNIGHGEDCGPNSAVDNLLIYNREPALPNAYKARTSINFMPSGFESAMPDNFVASIEPTLANCGTTGTAGDPIMPAGNLGQYDMGQDGRTNASNQPVNTNNNALYGNNTRTLDAYGFSLNYFAGDYKKISSTTQAPNPFAQISTGTGLLTDVGSANRTAKDLFNGNISAMAVSVPKLGAAMVYGYNYDQLNRITAMYAYKGISSTSNTFTTPTEALQAYREKVSYDANGNILSYKRNGDDTRLYMDDMTYTYKPNTNQLDKVVDAAPDAAASDYDKYNDIKRIQPPAVGSTTGQVNNNYVYDEIGNLIADKSESISNISWTVYGKISKIEKSDGKPTIYYTYDASGNRITKQVGDTGPTTYYVRDASGNVMSVYTLTPITGPINIGAATATVKQCEIHLYGSSRLGIYNVNRDINTLVAATYSGTTSTFARGNKFFELSNHLGNVLVTLSDKRLAVDSENDGIINYYNADVITANDYYPFGMTMPGRKYAAASSSYRYGFNGQMKDDEISEAGNSYTAEFWQYDSRLGRRWNQDPKPLPSVSNYACFANNPIFFADPKGDTAAVFKPDGSFWKFQDDGKKEWSGMLYQNSKVTGTKTANGTTSTYYEYSNPLTFQFNDAAVDVLALKNGVASNGAVGITRVEVMSDASVEKQIIRSGVRDANAQNSPMSYAKKQGANKMDYGVQGILTGDLKSNTFYVRGKTAYNVGDIGNYLWGKGMGELKIDHLTAKAGAHYNNIFNGRKQKTPMYDFGPGTYGSPGFWDSPGDQRAIRAGYMTTPFYWQQEQEAEKELKRLENNMKYGPKF